MKRQIFAIAGGGFSNEENPPRKNTYLSVFTCIIF